MEGLIGNLCTENDRLRKENAELRIQLAKVNGAKVDQEFPVGTLGHFYGKLTEIMQANPDHRNALVVNKGADIFDSFVLVQAFITDKGVFLTDRCVATQSLTQHANIIEISSTKQLFLSDHLDIEKDNFVYKLDVVLETLQPLSFCEAEELVEKKYMLDHGNRFIFSMTDGRWYKEFDVTNDVDVLRKVVTPSKRTVMLYHTEHSIKKLRETFSASRGELISLMLELKK